MLNIFLIFFYIGSIAFGGGWAVVGIIKDIMITQNYMSFNEFKEILAVAQLTPGPIAVNMATYIGYKYYGLVGAILNTFFLILPPVLIIITYSTLRKSIKIKKESLINSLKLGTLILIFLTLYNLGAQFLINFELRAIVLILLTFVLLVKTKINPIFFIIGTGLIAILIL